MEMKHDGGKPKLNRFFIQQFPLSMAAISHVMELGAERYTYRGWQNTENGIERYTDALVRHLWTEVFEHWNEEDKCSHSTQVAVNALIRLELELREQL